MGVLFSGPQTWDYRSVIGKAFLVCTKGAKRISGEPEELTSIGGLMIVASVVVTDDDVY